MRKLLYPKHYATVVRVLDARSPLLTGAVGSGPLGIVIEPGLSGQRSSVLWLAWRCGWGACGSRGPFDFAPGTVVKLYQRPQDRHPKFRRRGS
jgi:hypothetical protein